MIVSHVIGGLGNQMFQYAAGRALANRWNVPLRLDIADFGSYGLHNGFELSRLFSIAGSPASPMEMRQVLGWRSFRPVLQSLAHPRLFWLRGNRIVVEPHFQYWPGIENVTADCYIRGYWQSERYFRDVEAELRTEFEFRLPLDETNKQWAERIQSSNSVSLHVRRGDFVADPTTSQVHGACSIDYYRTAIDTIFERLENPVFFVFSDDIGWARTHIDIRATAHFLSHNVGSASYNDMRLMSLCRHHVIANSSFSWWGAWLNPRSDKTVVAPRQWFVVDHDTSDLVPSTWIRL